MGNVFIHPIVDNAIIFVAVGGAAFLIIFMFVKSQFIRKNQEMVISRFIDAEDEANAVRRKDISPELFYTPNLSVLPQLPEGDPHQVARTARRKMIHFSEPVSNLDLKMQYGSAQMETLAEYEENFNEYMRALTAWASTLMVSGETGDALDILEYTFGLGIEFRSAYRLAADIHFKDRNVNKLIYLLGVAEKNHFRDPAMQHSVLEYINRKLDELK